MGDRSESFREQLPPDLPRPEDDGAADGIAGREVPRARLESTGDEPVDLGAAQGGRLVVYVYPRTGRPGVSLPTGWIETPGALGCTLENCGFRDHRAELEALGARILGLSSQPLGEQREFAARERMPYPLLNDSELVLARELGLPTFEFAEATLYRRLTFVAREGLVEKVFYPVFPPDEHAAEVAAWLESRPLS
jgi:peroxiredoxin